jgi:polysaccharide biosynthesis transport protein
LPSKFTHIVPKLRASDYDYIVFDMPAISSMSTTPRLGGYMDIVLLVLESEKTGQQLASRATALMRESRANVAAVLNKYRAHVPARLSQEL